MMAAGPANSRRTARSRRQRMSTGAGSLAYHAADHWWSNRKCREKAVRPKTARCPVRRPCSLFQRRRNLGIDRERQICESAWIAHGFRQESGRNGGANALHQGDKITVKFIRARNGSPLGFLKWETCRTDAWSIPPPVTRTTND